MGFWDKIGLGLAVGGIGISVAVFFATYLWRDMPRWAAIAGFVIGILLCVGAISCIVFIPGEEQPDVQLSFINPPHPLISFANSSGVTAENIKYCVELWDLSKPKEANPLPVPWRLYDFLPAHSTGGPMDVFTGPLAKMNPGTKLFGSACVKCPNCSHGRTYVLYEDWGKGGWYWEVQNSSGGPLLPANFNNFNPVEFARYVTAQIPESQRTPIKGPTLIWGTP